MKIFDKKDGFTLIELLVVITILGILAFFVIADYGGEIIRNRVRIAQDTVYAEMQALKVSVLSGSYVQTDVETLYCKGLQIGPDGFERVSTTYDAENGCAYDSYEVEESVALADTVTATFSDDKINEDGGFICFLPPYGDIQAVGDNYLEAEGLYNLTIIFGEENSGYEKSIYIDFLTGYIELNDQVTE